MSRLIYVDKSVRLWQDKTGAWFAIWPDIITSSVSAWDMLDHEDNTFAEAQIINAGGKPYDYGNTGVKHILWFNRVQQGKISKRNAIPVYYTIGERFNSAKAYPIQFAKFVDLYYIPEKNKVKVLFWTNVKKAADGSLVLGIFNTSDQVEPFIPGYNSDHDVYGKIDEGAKRVLVGCEGEIVYLKGYARGDTASDTLNTFFVLESPYQVFEDATGYVVTDVIPEIRVDHDIEDGDSINVSMPVTTPDGSKEGDFDDHTIIDSFDREHSFDPGVVPIITGVGGQSTSPVSSITPTSVIFPSANDRTGPAKWMIYMGEKEGSRGGYIMDDRSGTAFLRDVFVIAEEDKAFEIDISAHFNENKLERAEYSVKTSPRNPPTEAIDRTRQGYERKTKEINIGGEEKKKKSGPLHIAEPPTSVKIHYSSGSDKPPENNQARTETVIAYGALHFDETKPYDKQGRDLPGGIGAWVPWVEVPVTKCFPNHPWVSEGTRLFPVSPIGKSIVAYEIGDSNGKYGTGSDSQVYMNNFQTTGDNNNQHSDTALIRILTGDGPRWMTSTEFEEWKRRNALLNGVQDENGVEGLARLSIEDIRDALEDPNSEIDAALLSMHGPSPSQPPGQEDFKKKLRRLQVEIENLSKQANFDLVGVYQSLFHSTDEYPTGFRFADKNYYGDSSIKITDEANSNSATLIKGTLPDGFNFAGNDTKHLVLTLNHWTVNIATYGEKDVYVTPVDLTWVPADVKMNGLIGWEGVTWNTRPDAIGNRVKVAILPNIKDDDYTTVDIDLSQILDDSHLTGNKYAIMIDTDCTYYYFLQVLSSVQGGESTIPQQWIHMPAAQGRVKPVEYWKMYKNDDDEVLVEDAINDTGKAYHFVDDLLYETIRSPKGKTLIGPAAGVTISGKEPDTNFESKDRYKISRKRDPDAPSTFYNEDLVLRFDASNISYLLSGHTAKLRFYANVNNKYEQTGRIYLRRIYNSVENSSAEGDFWQQSFTTWNEVLYLNDDNASILSESFNSSGWIEIDITDIIKVNSDRFISFRLYLGDISHEQEVSITERGGYEKLDDKFLYPLIITGKD